MQLLLSLSPQLLSCLHVRLCVFCLFAPRLTARPRASVVSSGVYAALSETAASDPPADALACAAKPSVPASTDLDPAPSSSAPSAKSRRALQKYMVLDLQRNLYYSK